MILDKKFRILLAVCIGAALFAAGASVLFFIVNPKPDTKELKPVPLIEGLLFIPSEQTSSTSSLKSSTTDTVDQIFKPFSTIENTAYIQEDSLIKLPDIGLQILFPPATSISNKISLRLVTAASITERLQGYNNVLDSLGRYEVGAEPPTYEVDTMDIKFFNQEKVNFAARKSFIYQGRSDVGGKEDYKVSVRKINDIWYLVYDMYLVFDNNFRVYSTFVGNKRLDIIVPLTKAEESIPEAEEMFGQVKLMPFNSSISFGSPNPSQLHEKDLQQKKLYSGLTVEMVQNDQESIFKFKINPKLPIYTFHFFSANQDQRGQIEIYDNSSSTKPKQIIVFDPNFWIPQPIIDIIDINFDGFLDIGLLATGGAKWASFQYWTFDPRVGLFVISPIAQEFRGIGFNEIKFDTKNKRITTSNFEGPLLALKQVYMVEEGRLKLIEEYHQEQRHVACIFTTKRYNKGAISELSEPEVSTEILNEDCKGYTLEE